MPRLQRVPEESIAVLASVCRTVSLATLHMVFPAPRYWRQTGSGGMPEYATAYVEDFLGECHAGKGCGDHDASPNALHYPTLCWQSGCCGRCWRRAGC